MKIKPPLPESFINTTENGQNKPWENRGGGNSEESRTSRKMTVFEVQSTLVPGQAFGKLENFFKNLCRKMFQKTLFPFLGNFCPGCDDNFFFGFRRVNSTFINDKG